MLLWLVNNLEHVWKILNVFQYITFRCIVSALTACLENFKRVSIYNFSLYCVGFDRFINSVMFWFTFD
jgi:hypothetical protein